MLAGIRAGENYSVRLPGCLFKASSGCVGQGGNTVKCFVRLTVAGAAQAGVLPGARIEKMYLAGRILLLPVELRCVNHIASTNKVTITTSGKHACKM